MSTWLRGAAAAGLIVLSATSPLAAQRVGAVEVGPFARYTTFGDLRDMPDAGAFFGARIGVFLTPLLSLEGDFSLTPAKERGPGGAHVKYFPARARLLFNPTLNDKLELIVGGGGVLNRYSNATAVDLDWGVGGLVGLRWYLVNNVALRFDGTVDLMPSFMNSSVIEVAPRPDHGEVRVEPGDQAHFGIQAGLSVVLGRRESILASRPVPATVD